jgi:indolepyruvate ferredoxin oxidoreductase, beta subunit
VKPANIYLCGVGGQGIGLLAEVMIQSCLSAGHRVKGVDTHGLAQRGGIVTSHIRLGGHVFSPRIPPGQADIVLGLERLEAYRAAVEMLRDGGTVVYYDCEYQPIHVRMGKALYPSADQLEQVVRERHGRTERVLLQLPDPRMQNTALLGRFAALGVVEGLTPAIVEAQLSDVLPAPILEENLAVFRAASLAPALPQI